MKDAVETMDGKIEDNTKRIRNIPSGVNENIIVAGGDETVEMFNWRQRKWSPLK